MNANTDPLDAAYLAIGAARALDVIHANRFTFTSGGEVDTIAAAIAHAPLLQRLWDEVGEGWAGVWVYDVAEPLGAWTVDNPDADAARVESVARDLIQQAQSIAGL